MRPQITLDYSGCFTLISWQSWEQFLAIAMPNAYVDTGDIKLLKVALKTAVSVRNVIYIM